MRRLVLTSLAALTLLPFALGLATREARAQGAAISTTLDASVRAAGMGRASSSVFWGGDPDSWANPALLGYHHGVRYDYGRTQLIPSLASDVIFTTKRVTLGAYGFGILIAGKPVDKVGSLRLSYGLTQATSSTGEVLAAFEPFEEISSFGIGVSLAEATEAVWRATGDGAPSIARYGDVALGLTKKDVHVFLSPAFSGMPEVSGNGTAEDRGIFIRLSPLNTFDGGGPAALRAVRLRLDLGHGRSTLNRGQPLLDLGPAIGPEPMVEETRKGWSAHFALHPVDFDQELEHAHLGWLARSVSPMISVGLAWEDQTEHFASGTGSPDQSQIDKHGWEATLLNIVSFRGGHVSDPDGGVEGSTSGWGAGFAFEGAAGFRYDRATVPQASGLTRVKRKAWSFFVDPVRAVRVL